MSNEIKQGDKVRVSKDAPKIYTKDGFNLATKMDFEVVEIEDECARIENADGILAMAYIPPTKYLVKVDAEAKEARFKVGDRVRYIGDMQPTCKGKTFVIDGEVFFNDYYNQWQTRSIKPFAWDGLSVCNVPLTDLESYTEPREDVSKMKPIESKVSVYLATKKEDEEFRMLLHENGFMWNNEMSLISQSNWASDPKDFQICFVYPDKTVTYCGERTEGTLTFTEFKKQYFGEEDSPNVNNSDIDIAELVNKGYVPDPAKQFDNILKDSFSKERRLNIAAMMAQGIMTNSNPQMVEMNVERVVDLAILTADTLIAECEKGGTHDKYYFVSYIAQVNTGAAFSHCIFKAIDITLNGMAEKIAKSRDDCKSVTILSLKDLTKDEYEMLSGE